MTILKKRLAVLALGLAVTALASPSYARGAGRDISASDPTTLLAPPAARCRPPNENSCGCGFRPPIGRARVCSTSHEWRGSPPTGPSASTPKTFGKYPLNFPPNREQEQTS